MSFSSFKLHPLLDRAVGVLGYKAPTPIQSQAIPIALEGRDILGCAQTGSGKTVAFALPILQRLLASDPGGLRALVLVPTRELAVQVERTFKDLGRFTSFKTAVVIGGVSHSGQTRSVQGGATVLVATPGRLLDHLRQGNFSLKYIEQLVLDEADRMLDMGFLPEIKAIIQQMPADRQTQLFSATLHANVESIAAFATRNPLRVEIARPSTVAEGISQILYPVIQSQKAGLLTTLLKTTEMRSVLVFTRTKHGADKVASRLKDEGYKVGTLHSNRSQNQRQQAMDDFRQLRIQILVATDIAARGIDVKNISHVVNFDVPRFPEDYVHRVGRTARAYGVGDAILMVDPQEEPFVKGIEKFIQVTFPRATVPNFQYNKPPKGGPSGGPFGPLFHKHSKGPSGPLFHKHSKRLSGSPYQKRSNPQFSRGGPSGSPLQKGPNGPPPPNPQGNANKVFPSPLGRPLTELGAPGAPEALKRGQGEGSKPFQRNRDDRDFRGGHNKSFSSGDRRPGPSFQKGPSGPSFQKHSRGGPSGSSFQKGPNGPPPPNPHRKENKGFPSPLGRGQGEGPQQLINKQNLGPTPPKFSWGRKPKPAGGHHSKFWSNNKKKSFHGGSKKGSWGQKPSSPDGFSSDRARPGNRPPEKQGFIGYFRKKFRKG
ncbi:MAG: DEAD/DEAH box helicase [Elusimicrobia bacterium]|nr:DEAD/DEAH box helicase [Elusimicrobiota bacterium]